MTAAGATRRSAPRRSEGLHLGGRRRCGEAQAAAREARNAGRGGGGALGSPASTFRLADRHLGHAFRVLRNPLSKPPDGWSTRVPAWKPRGRWNFVELARGPVRCKIERRAALVQPHVTPMEPELHRAFERDAHRAVYGGFEAVALAASRSDTLEPRISQEGEIGWRRHAAAELGGQSPSRQIGARAGDGRASVSRVTPRCRRSYAPLFRPGGLRPCRRCGGGRRARRPARASGRPRRR